MPTKKLEQAMIEIESSDARTRARALKTISETQDHTVETLLAVGRRLDDMSGFVGYEQSMVPSPVTVSYKVAGFAVLAICKIAMDSSSAVSSLIKRIPDMGESDKTIAMKIIATLGNPPWDVNVEVLFIGASTDKSWALAQTMIHLAKALITLSPSDIVMALSTITASPTKLPQQVNDLFQAYAKDSPERERDVIKILSNPSYSYTNNVVSEGQKALIEFLKSLEGFGESAIPYLLEVIRHNSTVPRPESRWKRFWFNPGAVYEPSLRSIKTLQRIGKPAQSALLEASQNSVPDIKEDAERALQAIGKGSR
jgi:hypothetical protein